MPKSVGSYEFDALILKHPNMDAAFIEFLYDVFAEFGTKGQVKVVALLDGFEYRGSLAKMGHRCHILGITKKVRKAIGKEPGDTVHVILREDTEPREVRLPDDFENKLQAHRQARAFFESLSYTNKKEYVRWITSAKKRETRERRIEDSIGLLVDGIKHP
jgi:hypothetical protein